MSTATPPLAATLEVRPKPDFSLIVGGPLYQLLRRTRLSDDGLHLAHRRIAVAVFIAWVIPLVLAALQGGLLAPGRKIPFSEDLGFHLRFLVVAPLLILSEVIVHRRLQPIVAQIMGRRLVPAHERARYDKAVAEATRWRDAVLAELILLGFVYVVGILVTRRVYMELGPGGWYAAPAGGLSLAGIWMVFVSLPLLQFLLLRWYYRLFIWGRFLWRLSRLDLDLNATHPDKAGGLGFLAGSVAAFVPLAAAHGAQFAGTMADRIFFDGAKLTEFKMDLVGGAAFLVVIFGAPLAVFAPRLAQVKRAGLAEYGALGQTYVREFREKWMSGATADEPLIGSGDIQSLADLGNSFASAEQMRLAPIQLRSLASVVVAFLAPVAPLLLTMMSFEKLIGGLVKLVF